MSLLEIKTFIKGISPFDKLDEVELQKFSNLLDVVYSKENVEISSPNQPLQNLYFIIKGNVQELDGEEVISLYSKNEFFDPISLIENNSKHTFKTTSETLFYTLAREDFLKFMYSNTEIETYFFKSISEKLNQSLNDNQNKELVNFMVSRVKDAFIQKPLILDSNISIFESVQKMKEAKASSILVKNGDKIGIATDTDFREKVILNRLDFDQPIDLITSYAIRFVDENEFLFNAQLKMTKHRIKRLVVRNIENEITGILDLITITSFFASHTYAVANELEMASNIDELKKASDNFIRVIRALYAKGVKVRYISKLLSELNEKLYSKLFEFLAPKELVENCALIIMGSEGRAEQILRTDQDNALIIGDNCDLNPEEIEQFAINFNDRLCDFGIPRCEGNIMLSNNYWRKNETDFKLMIFDWIHNKSEEHFMNFAIFFDAKAIAGNITLLDNVKHYLAEMSSNSPAFLSHFAKSALAFETPLGFFADFVVDKKEHKNELDIKKGGIFAIVQGARSLALEYKISQTNTIERLKALNEAGILEREFTSELIEAFTFLLSLRLKTRLDKIDKGLQPDNYINPNSLHKLERDLLKDSFKIVDKFKKFLSYHYKLGQL